MSRRIQSLWFLVLALGLPALGLGPEDAKYEVSLYTGITGVVRLGESYVQITQRLKPGAFNKIELSEIPELSKLKFLEGIAIPDMGAKVFFRRTGAVLITLQEPFKGTVRTKRIQLFSFTVPAVDDWETLLIRELGQPDLRASGGRFSSQALFYNWGDISFNRMGPNQLALYRDVEIAKWRQSSFGREIELFKTK